MPQNQRRPAQTSELRQNFVDRTRQDAVELDDALSRLKTFPQSKTDLEFLQQKAHTLTGRLSMFGYPEASAEAEEFRAGLSRSPLEFESILRDGAALSARLRSLSA